MKVRAIDDKHDWIFGKGLQNYKQNREAVKQRIKTHILSWYYDCFFDLEFGIDWKNLLGSRKKEKEIVISCRKQILLIDEITSCENINFNIDENRTIHLTYSITDIYGFNISDEITIGV